MIVTRKLKLAVIDDNRENIQNIYTYIKDEQYQQYKAMNLGISLLYTHYLLKGVGSGAEIKLKNQIENINKVIKKDEESLQKVKKSEKEALLNKRITENKKKSDEFKVALGNLNESRILEDKQFKEKYIDDLYTILQSQVSFTNKDNMSLVVHKLNNDFETILKNGLARGERSLNNYKRDNPLMIRGRHLVLSKDGDDYYIKWIRDIKFKVIIGRKDKDRKELLHTLENVLNYQSVPNLIDKIVDGKPILDEKNKVKRIDNPAKDYKICDSSFQVDGNKLILNLTIEIKNSIERNFIPGRIVGVDLGIIVPAYVCLNKNLYFIRKSIGSYESFMKINLQMKNARARMYKQISKSKGGKGRENKLSAIDKLKIKRSNYNTTYNHFLSKEIVNFAFNNKAEQINLEFITSEIFKKDKLLADWSYYQLQEMIKSKADKVGIIVRYVDPYLTSQTCSICGNYEEGQRENQNTFMCKQCGKIINADYNASQNIANSKKYVSSIEETEYYKLKKSGKIYNNDDEEDVVSV